MSGGFLQRYAVFSVFTASVTTEMILLVCLVLKSGQNKTTENTTTNDKWGKIYSTKNNVKRKTSLNIVV